MNPQLVRYSKFLSLVLRHHPQRIGLALDRGGWANAQGRPYFLSISQWCLADRPCAPRFYSISKGAPQ